MNILRRLNLFLIGILAAVFLGWLFNEAGARGGLLRTELTTQVAVFLIFLSQGLILPSEELKRGILQWRFHLFCTLFIFVLFPGVTGLVLLGLHPLLSGQPWWTPELMLGFLFLGILPTTITTAVVYTGKSGGNVGSALFCTAFTNIAGIFIVPLAAIALASGLGILERGGAFSYGPVLLKICLLLLLPFILGQLIRPAMKGWVDRYRPGIRNGNVLLVYYIVFAAFANSFHQETWSQYSLLFLVAVTVLTGLLLLLFSAAAWYMARGLRFSRGDCIAAFFCGSQKTLAAGIPLAGSLFVDGPVDTGLVILPLMIYHALQLVFHGYFVGRWERGEPKTVQ